jgi:NAD(P)H-flavin reductase
MKHISCTVATTADAFEGHKIVSLAAPDMPHMRPGQLVLARVHDTLDPYLPSAYFPLSALHPATLLLLVDCADPISRKPVGDPLELIAPIGNGFTLDPATRRLLLVGDAAHLAPLLALAHEASDKQIAVSLLVHSIALDPQHPDTGNVSLSAWLSQLLPLEVECQLTSDLSAVLPGLLGWADQLCAAGGRSASCVRALALPAHPLSVLRTPGQGPVRGQVGRAQDTVFRAAAEPSRTDGMLDTGGVLPAGDTALHGLLKEQLAREAQVIVAPPMACGFGACMGCAVETARGIRLACVDGPVFDLAELL